MALTTELVSGDYHWSNFSNTTLPFEFTLLSFTQYLVTDKRYGL